MFWLWRGSIFHEFFITTRLLAFNSVSLCIGWKKQSKQIIKSALARFLLTRRHAGFVGTISCHLSPATKVLSFIYLSNETQNFCVYLLRLISVIISNCSWNSANCVLGENVNDCWDGWQCYLEPVCNDSWITPQGHGIYLH